MRLRYLSVHLTLENPSLSLSLSLCIQIYIYTYRDIDIYIHIGLWEGDVSGKGMTVRQYLYFYASKASKLSICMLCLTCRYCLQLYVYVCMSAFILIYMYVCIYVS
jgi:hypothetical protein